LEFCKENNTVQSYFMKISHTYFSKCFSQMAEYGIHPGQMALLKLLYARNGLKQSEICKALNIKPSTAAVSVKRLEKSGLVERRPDEKDQRVSRVYITERTREAGLRVFELLMENEKMLLQGFNETEVCLLKRFLQQILDNMELLPGKDEKIKQEETTRLC